MAPPEIDRTREESLSLSTDYADLCKRSFQASMTGHSFLLRAREDQAASGTPVRRCQRSGAIVRPKCFRLGRAAGGKRASHVGTLANGRVVSGTVRRMPVNPIAMLFSSAAAIDSSSLIDPPRLETGVRLARLLSLWERLGEGAKLESQNRKSDPGYGFSVFAKPTSSIKRSASTALSMRRSS